MRRASGGPACGPVVLRAGYGDAKAGCSTIARRFGTGFASFTYLKLLPVQYLKIDVDFIRNLTRNRQDVALVKTIVALAGEFGQQTIAEGVEDEATADALHDLGVTFAQGYLFGRSVPTTDGAPPAAVG